MTNEELQAEIEDLKRQINELREEQLSYRQKLRLINALQGSKTYYVVPGATGPTGPSTQKLTFIDGVLQKEI